MKFSRRLFSALFASAAFVFSVAGAHADDKLIRVGFQKYGKLVLLKNKGLLEEKLKPLGIKVQWIDHVFLLKVSADNEGNDDDNDDNDRRCGNPWSLLIVCLHR